MWLSRGSFLWDIIYVQLVWQTQNRHEWNKNNGTANLNMYINICIYIYIEREREKFLSRIFTMCWSISQPLSLPSVPPIHRKTLSIYLSTLQETNISHLGKRKIIFKYALSRGYVNSPEGIYQSFINIIQHHFIGIISFISNHLQYYIWII